MGLIDNLARGVRYNYCRACKKEMLIQTKKLYFVPLNASTEISLDTKFDYFEQNAIPIQDMSEIPTGFHGGYAVNYLCGSCGKRVEAFEVFLPVRGQEVPVRSIQVEDNRLRNLKGFDEFEHSSVYENTAIYESENTHCNEMIQNPESSIRNLSSKKKLVMVVVMAIVVALHGGLRYYWSMNTYTETVQNQSVQTNEPISPAQSQEQQPYIKGEGIVIPPVEATTDKLSNKSFVCTYDDALLSLEEDGTYRYYALFSELEDNYFQGTYEVYYGKEAITKFVNIEKFRSSEEELETYIDSLVESGYVVGLHDIPKEDVYSYDEEGNPIAMNPELIKEQVTKDDFYTLICYPKLLYIDGEIQEPDHESLTYIGFYIDTRNGIEFTHCDFGVVAFWEVFEEDGDF